MSEDISAQVIKKTQTILGKYVKKPPLTDKLLKKPPFRFLHDIVTVIINETGYLKGLYSEEELKTENVKEKDAKIAFLNKLIDAVKATTKADLAVRSSKIVAGLEPTKTNLLLQAIGKALDAKIDASGYIAQINSSNLDSTKQKEIKKTSSSRDNKAKTTPKTNTLKDEVKVTKNKKRIGESPRSKVKASTPKDSTRSKKTDKTSTKREAKDKEEKQESLPKKDEHANSKLVSVGDSLNSVEKGGNKDEYRESGNAEQNEKIENVDEEKIEPELTPDEMSQNVITKPDLLVKDEKIENVEKLSTENKAEVIQIENSHTEDTNSSAQSLKRPKSARPKSGERRLISSKQRVENVEILKPLEMTMNQTVQRPKSSLRPPSVRPSSARPGAPRLRPDSALPLQETIPMGAINVIIENVDNVDEEETVIIQTMSEMTEEPIGAIKVPQENKGQLVEQILEQIQEEEGVKKRVDIDWDEDVLHTKDGAFREISQLRTLIQTLTKTANPLGKLLNYLHEDIEAMHGELQYWTNIKNQLFAEINKQKRLSAESNKPLLAHLQQLQEEIKKQGHEIINTRSNILRNDFRITELLNT